jgi:hypothetical protein
MGLLTGSCARAALPIGGSIGVAPTGSAGVLYVAQH